MNTLQNPSTPSYRRWGLTLLCCALVGLGACASPQGSSTVYKANETGREQIVRTGVIESLREVTIQSDNNGVGAIAGGVVGGVAGSNVGQGKGSTVGTVLGAVAGGVLGQAVERNFNTRKGLEITVRMDNSGEIRSVVQEADQDFRVGERVRLLSSGGTTRVSR